MEDISFDLGTERVEDGSGDKKQEGRRVEGSVRAVHDFRGYAQFRAVPP